MNQVIIKAEVTVAFDEDEQMAQDYSIVICNPPHDPYDPQLWKDFFHDIFDGAHATACTIGVTNDLLVSLGIYPENWRLIETKVKPETPSDTLTLARLAAEKGRI